MKEWTKDCLKVTLPMLVDPETGKITTSLEPRFDVGEKFGLRCKGDPNAEINLYAIWDPDSDTLELFCLVCSSIGKEECSYLPTDPEKELVMDLLRKACFQNFGCSLEDLSSGMLSPGLVI